MGLLTAIVLGLAAGGGMPNAQSRHGCRGLAVRVRGWDGGNSRHSADGVLRTDTGMLDREYDGQGGIRVTVCYTSYRTVSKYAACVLC
jgi:hypothetical protein